MSKLLPDPPSCPPNLRSSEMQRPPELGELGGECRVFDALQTSSKSAIVHDRPEIDLLLACARTHVDAATATQIKLLLQQAVDWEWLLQLAVRHGLAPLLYQTLNAVAPDAVPEQPLTQLRNAFHANARRNLFQTGELLNLVNRFEAASIPMIPFKGPILAASVYKNLALRRFGDLDLLVHPRDIDRAKALLMAHGYELLVGWDWEYHFEHPTKGTNVDLHQALTPRFFAFNLGFEELRSQLQSCLLAGQQVPNFAAEDLLLILSTQVGKDCCHWRLRVAQLCDVAELIRTHPDLNWTEVIERSRRLGIERILLLTLSLTQALLTVELPDSILERLQNNPHVDALVEQVKSKLWCPVALQFPKGVIEPESKTEEDGFWSFLWSYDHRFYLSLRERFFDKIAYGWCWLLDCLFFAIVPNKKDTEFLPLPQGFHFLYYPLHWVRLVNKHALRWGK